MESGGTFEEVGSVDISSPFDFIVFVSSSSASSKSDSEKTAFAR